MRPVPPGIAMQCGNPLGQIEAEAGAIATDRLHVLQLAKLLGRKACTIIGNAEFQPFVTLDGSNDDIFLCEAQGVVQGIKQDHADQIFVIKPEHRCRRQIGTDRQRRLLADIEHQFIDQVRRHPCIDFGPETLFFQPCNRSAGGLVKRLIRECRARFRHHRLPPPAWRPRPDDFWRRVW